jgi:prepilin peptidase CpaA
MICTALLLGLVLIASLTDVLRHKIYNWNTYTGMLAALGLSAVGSGLLAVGMAEENALANLGWLPLSTTLSGWAICGAVMLVCFLLFRIGGGDVKLIAMMGAFLGPDKGIEAMLWTFVLGGCVGLIVLVFRVGPVRLAAKALRRVLWMLRLATWMPLSEDERAVLQPPLFLAPSALAAVVIVRFSLINP